MDTIIIIMYRQINFVGKLHSSKSSAY